MDSDDDFMSEVSSHEEPFEDDSPESDVGSLGDDFDEEEPADGLSQSKEIIKPRRLPYEVDFSVLEPTDIQAEQDKQINEVSAVLGQSPENTAILLRYFRWNKERLIDMYMERLEDTLEKAGLGRDNNQSPKVSKARNFACSICYEDGNDLETFKMRCGHEYCIECYQHYLIGRIKDDGEAARIQCPKDRCDRIVDSKSLHLLVPKDVEDRYKVLLMRTYIDDKENLKWCPGPDCENAVQCAVKKRELDRVVPSVTCCCKHRFCFGCTLNDHQPAPCSLVKQWLKKCEDDSETANWISANTKECPKCSSTIEKNGGCNHMTCRKCKHEFCWMCMGLWSEHGTSWYSCNRFEEKSGLDGRDQQAKSRASLERYLHYYNRYANHEQSAKLDKDLWLKTEKKMQQLQLSSSLSWIEVQFLETASVTLQQCRQTLKWTYAFAFYLEGNNLAHVFEGNQSDLEMAVEKLSEMFEKSVSELAELKVPMLDRSSYCNKRRQILLSVTADELRKGEWKFVGLV